jgi:hypothetical protein
MKQEYIDVLYTELSEGEANAISGGSSFTCWAAGACFVGGLVTGQFEVSLFSGWYIANYC